MKVEADFSRLHNVGKVFTIRILDTCPGLVFPWGMIRIQYAPIAWTGRNQEPRQILSSSCPELATHVENTITLLPLT